MQRAPIPPFENRCVAFLDVLGFKELIAQAEMGGAGFSRLASLITVIESHVRFDSQSQAQTVDPRYTPKYLFISDSIIISSIDDNIGRSVVVVKAIQIALKLLELGFLLRGGISRGSAWHEEHNIFGSAYSNAYLLESTNANYPRIILDESMKQAWDKDPAGSSSLILVDDDKHPFCNVLHPYYVTGAEIHGRIESCFMQIRAWIFQNLKRLSRGSKAHSHWNRMAEYFNRAVEREKLHIDLL